MCNDRKNCYIQVLPKDSGHPYPSFHIYLPAGERHYAQYCFFYLSKPADPTLSFSDRANSQANSSFYRIQSAYIGTLNGASFSPLFRALQEGELGFAFRENGAGDFSGGIHGDEVLQSVTLLADGSPVSLDQPMFASFQSLTFEETSYIYRCNTPDSKLVFHKQIYTVSGNTIKLSQRIEWIADALPLQAAYSPMLTAQRLDPDCLDSILTDTVAFYSEPEGRLLMTFDTSGYGSHPEPGRTDRSYLDTPATAVKVYGKTSGFMAETGFQVVNGTIPPEQISSHLWIRYAPGWDSKVYFNISAGSTPKTGTIWESNIYYRLTYAPKQ